MMGFWYKLGFGVCRGNVTVCFQRNTSSETERMFFKGSKILLLKKLTRYEFNKITLGHLGVDGLKAHLRSTGSDYEGLLVRHKEHYMKVEELLKSLESRKVDIKVVDRFGYTREAIDWADIVLTAGGDGTFLLGASRIIDDKPILGINTDPLSSEGYLCISKKFSYNIDNAINHLFAGKFDWLWRQRITVSLSGVVAADLPIELHELQLQYPEHRTSEHVRESEETVLKTKPTTSVLQVLPFKALNEVFIGESLSARVSYYEMSVDESNSQKQKSSGVTISTGTGSSSWSFHINHISDEAISSILKLTQHELSRGTFDSSALNALNDGNLIKKVCKRYNSRLWFSPEEPRMAYTVRDPIKNKIFHVAYPRGFAKKITVRSRMWDAHVVIDGGFSYKFNDGAVANLEIDPSCALRCLNLHAY